MKCQITLLLFLPFVLNGQINSNEEAKDSIWYEDYVSSVENLQQAKSYSVIYKKKKIDSLLSTALKEDLISLDSIYRMEIDDFLRWYRNDSERNSRNIYPYLSSCNRFESLYLYPQIYNILFNPVRLNTNKKLGKARYERAIVLITEIGMKVEEEDLARKLKTHFEEYLGEKEKMDTYLFQGDLPEEERKSFNMVDFLILLVR